MRRLTLFRLCCLIFTTKSSPMADNIFKKARLNADDNKDVDLDNDTIASDQPTTFPNTLEGFGYYFNSEKRLRSIKTEESFKFDISNNHDENQRRYEAVGDVITQYVYQLLESECGLKKLYLPISSRVDEPRTFVFVSDDALTNPDKLLLILHGSGVVRAGQWARRLIINDCLDSGTQLPYIKRAQLEGYGIIVLNSNDNELTNKDGKLEKIKGSESPEQHTKYVWENIVKGALAKNIAIVAHSYGGLCIMELLKSHEKSLMERVFAIALTDSVHSLAHQNISKSANKWLQKVCCNWISSKEPLDTPIPIRVKADVPRVSAGDRQHEMTSWSSFKSVFRFLSQRYRDVRQTDSEVGANEEL